MRGRFVHVAKLTEEFRPFNVAQKTPNAALRMESGSSLPSMRTLARFARATHSELKIQFNPLPSV